MRRRLGHEAGICQFQCKTFFDNKKRVIVRSRKTHREENRGSLYHEWKSLHEGTRLLVRRANKKSQFVVVLMYLRVTVLQSHQLRVKLCSVAQYSHETVEFDQWTASYLIQSNDFLIMIGLAPQFNPLTQYPFISTNVTGPSGELRLCQRCPVTVRDLLY